VSFPSLEHHQFGGIALDHRDPTTVYLRCGNDVGGWDLERWSMESGGAWSIMEITNGSTEKNIRPAVPADAPPFVDMVVWMSGIYEYWENLGAEPWWPVDASGAAYQTALKLWVNAPPTDVGDVGAVPEMPILFAIRPNPSRNTSVLTYSVPAACDVTLRINDVAGRVVRILIRRKARQPGTHRAVWDGTDAAGREVGSGVYFCRLEAGPAAVSRTLIRLE
jgi:hypothetical protein